MTDFKIKIDLENQSVVQETPKKGSKKRRRDPNKTGGEKSRKKKQTNHPTEPKIDTTNKKKKKKKEQPHHVETEKKKINSNSIISLTLLPNNESVNKLDQVQKLSLITKKKPRHWEKRWVLVPNVFEFTKEIWIKKWVLVDGGDDIVDNNNYLQTYYSSSIKPYKDSLPKKYQCSFDECRKIFTDSSSLRKHLLTHGERHVNKIFNPKYICKHEECGKKFLDNSKLRRHQLVHTGEKPFKCDLCGKKFSLDFNLKTHLRTHTGEKPYICSYSGCDKRFTQSSNLTAHEKTHKEMEKKEGSSTGQVANSDKKEGKPIFGLKHDEEDHESVHSLQNSNSQQ